MYKKVDVTMGLNGILVGLVSITAGLESSFIIQVFGVVATGAFVVVTSSIDWFALKYTIGIRVSEEEEMLGCDATEIVMEAYPDFHRVSTGGSSGISGYTASVVAKVSPEKVLNR